MSSYGINGYDDHLDAPDPQNEAISRAYKDGFEDGRHHEQLDHNCHDVCEECGDLDSEYALGRTDGISDYLYRFQQLEHDIYWNSIDYSGVLTAIQLIIQDMEREG